MGSKKRQHKKNTDGDDGMVYSTNPNATFADLFADLRSGDALESADAASRPTLYVSLDRKQRAGKPVTLVEGVPEADIKALGKALKQLCGVGGTVKEGQILVQGDFRDAVVADLTARGFQVKRKGG